ncbi:tRNA pseudouridine(38-40) synthase TruA [Amaricoccus macauensis]|uniref:tRNA pseudouridine(38-40) synthase TruA n=1 Tax=Amaricoccus macauensis TaxID=57001 RepID=UPI003C7C538F
MPRYALKIEYDGRPFSGWQRQADHPSVQGALEAAAARLDPSGPAVNGAGRTDAGVHADGQVAHLDMARVWDPERLREALNAHLRPHPVAVVAAAEVSDEFHARFSAILREYRFCIVSRRAPLVRDAGFAWRVNRPLDLEAMRAGARHLVGRHDFTTFRSTMCQADSPLKTLDIIEIDEVPYPAGQAFRFRLEARSFLHNQVRSIVGTLERVGAGAWPPARVAEALEARNRAACGPVCPPDGLSLVSVGYPEDPFGIAGNA